MGAMPCSTSEPEIEDVRLYVQKEHALSAAAQWHSISLTRDMHQKLCARQTHHQASKILLKINQRVLPEMQHD